MVELVRQIALTIGILAAMSAGPSVNAQFDKIEGIDTPDDVTGADCTMCHGTTAAEYKFLHEPAATNKCTVCHLEKGEGTHGGLVKNDRTLCLQCHKDKEEHYPSVTCWTSSCHSDIHGSKHNKILNPSMQEAYPGFTESTAGAHYVGTAMCLSCHAATCASWSESVHSLSDADGRATPSMRGCESCHGPGSNHMGRRAGIGDFNHATPAETDQVCLVCHKDETYTPDYNHNSHVKSGVSCKDCHAVHQQSNLHNLKDKPNEVCLGCHQSQRADFAKLSHHPLDNSDSRTGMLCTSCHNPHGGEGRTMLKTDRDELCFSCHANKQGPFIYEHAGYQPGLGQGCTSCHSPHGSSSPSLLRMSGRGLCLQCHSDRVTHFPAQTCWSTGCHSDHHGSNKDYFFFDK